jgi:putative Holliday junction resolvase
MGDEIRWFVRSLVENLAIPVILHDETLTTKEAQEKSIKAGIKRKKRRKMEDAYAASLILQSYLDDL